MIGRKDMKQETMAKRARNRAMANEMAAPRKKMDMGMSPGPDMGAASAPPMMSSMGMKKGGAVKKGKSIVGTGKSPAAAKADYKKKMKAASGSKKGGLMLIIGIGGKKKGK